ncbi:MAG: hypothetical protein ACKE8G_05390 [Methylophagaceae bacterium]
MKQQDARILLLISTIACVYGCYLQIDFLSAFFNHAGSLGNNENLAGVILAGFIFSITWAGAFLLLIWKKEYFSTIERIVAFIPSSFILVTTILTIVLDFLF